MLFIKVNILQNNYTFSKKLDTIKSQVEVSFLNGI